MVKLICQGGICTKKKNDLFEFRSKIKRNSYDLLEIYYSFGWRGTTKSSFDAIARRSTLMRTYSILGTCFFFVYVVCTYTSYEHKSANKKKSNNWFKNKNKGKKNIKRMIHMVSTMYVRTYDVRIYLLYIFDRSQKKIRCLEFRINFEMEFCISWNES